MTWDKGWTKKAEGEEDLMPLPEADQNRPGPPPLPTPGDIEMTETPPEPPPPPQPLPKKEMLKTLENASRSVLDCGLDLEKAHVALMKIDAYTASNPKDRETLSRIKDFAVESEKIKDAAEQLAKEMNEFKDAEGSPPPVGAPSAWLNR